MQQNKLMINEQYNRWFNEVLTELIKGDRNE